MNKQDAEGTETPPTKILILRLLAEKAKQKDRHITMLYWLREGFRLYPTRPHDVGDNVILWSRPEVIIQLLQNIIFLYKISCVSSSVGGRVASVQIVGHHCIIPNVAVKTSAVLCPPFLDFF